MQNTIGQTHVDNILKMLLGVLSVAGLIAMVIPQKNPIAEPSLESRAAIDAAPVGMSSSAPPPPPPAQMSTQFNSEPQSSFQIGAPTIDGNPMQPDFGLPFGMSAQTSSSNGDTAQNSQGSFTPPPYSMPGSTPPQPEGGEQDGPMISNTPGNQ